MKSVILIVSLLFSISSKAALTISTYNIRNFDYDSRSHTPTNKAHLVSYLKQLQSDLLAVQEINNTRMFSEMINKHFSSYKTSFTECGGAHGQKLGFVYNSEKLELLSFYEDGRTSNPNDPQFPYCNNGGSRPLAIAKFKIKDSNEVFVAISLHLKSGGNHKSIKKRFKQLAIVSNVLQDLKRQGVNNHVIMGDFNSTEYIKKTEHFKAFKQFLNENSLINTTTDIKCSSYWWGGVNDQKLYPSILDHILISKNFLLNKSSTSASMGHCKKLQCKVSNENTMGIGYDEVSDHCPLTTKVK